MLKLVIDFTIDAVRTKLLEEVRAFQFGIEEGFASEKRVKSGQLHECWRL
jgi:hypothetical protein